jgi:protein subunit release factor A
MSVAGISGSNFFQSYFTPSAQNKFQQIQSQFQQLGQDLQSGNLTQAQADYATLTQELPSAQQQSASTTTATSTNGIAQEFQTLGQDLQAGNLTAAQQAFATIQQDTQQALASGQTHHHHHAAGSGQQNAGNTLAQAFGALGQALQSGNLSTAQQAYASLEQDLQQYFSSSSATSASLSASSGSVSLNA